MPTQPKGFTYVTAAFVEGKAIPTFAEVLAQGQGTKSTWRRLARDLASCRAATLVIGGKKYRSTIHPLRLPRIGSSSSAYSWAFTVSGVKIGVDLILFHVGRYAGELTYGDLGPPLDGTVLAFAKAAVSKVKGEAEHVPATVSIESAPVRIAHTKLGAVAYRMIGSGPPLLLITGYGGTMEDWDHRLVDALAQHYRVVIFDNAGMGRTKALRPPLTIDAMANQTSALIDALGLRQTTVLGWSMGSMIAEALTVLHPEQVRRLILCAAYPGDGSAIRPAQKAINDLNSANPQKVMSVLFPANQSGAKSTYLAAISGYPAASPESSANAAAQAAAVNGWWGGRDVAGHKITSIAVPTLIADGAQDRLDPLRNTYAVAKLISGAQIKLYPDAGHDFLFQDEASFVTAVETFLR